jgi:hypothetical protein
MSEKCMRLRIFSAAAAGVAVAVTSLGMLAASCSRTSLPASPSPLAELSSAAMDGRGDHGGHGSSSKAIADDKGYIDGWFHGDDVQLYYTKSYFCAEPPSSGAPSNCEIGAPPELAPRAGPIPTIYAIAAVGFQPDPTTVACIAGTPCLNHPAMIDLSRIGGPPSAVPVSHSHILDRRGAGWFNTVNIRVFNAAAWNAIAAAKTLAKVRELQGGNPNVGVPGVISADTPTNIYFFIAGFRPES